MIDSDILDTLDALCALNGSSRSHLLNEMLRPSLPALNELLDLSHRMKEQANPEKTAQTLKTLNHIETQLNKPIEQIPNYIKGLQKWLISKWLA